ncbi:MAG: hypothetical protein GXO65_01005 [Euryarchaeota archaeon]|nr:hypothetical protein [Euryarchaeota archaeon]
MGAGLVATAVFLDLLVLGFVLGLARAVMEASRRGSLERVEMNYLVLRFTVDKTAFLAMLAGAIPLVALTSSLTISALTGVPLGTILRLYLPGR